MKRHIIQSSSHNLRSKETRSLRWSKRLAEVKRYLPLAQQADDEVSTKALVQELGDEVQVGDEGRLQDDGHIACVEELDGVRALSPPSLLASHRQINPEALHQLTLFARVWPVLLCTSRLDVQFAETLQASCMCLDNSRRHVQFAYLEVDDHKEDGYGCKKIGHIGEILSIEGLL